MALLQPSLVKLIVEKCPSKKESQEYQKWTIDVMKTAQQSVDDLNISRNVSACAKYLIVRMLSFIIPPCFKLLVIYKIDIFFKSNSGILLKLHMYSILDLIFLKFVRIVFKFYIVPLNYQCSVFRPFC